METEERKRRWRIFWKFLFIVAGVYVILIIIASPLTKYLVHRYDEKYTGRKITVGRALVNPLGGAASLRNVRMYEAGSDSVFLSARKLSADLSVLKLLSGTYEINSVKIDRPVISITREDTTFNFSDLIERFSVQEDTLEEEEMKLNILNIDVSNGHIRYEEKDLPFSIDITEINFRSPGMKWDVDSLTGEYSFIPGEGIVSGDFMITTDSLDYRINTDVSGFNFSVFTGYLKGLTGSGNIDASVNMNINAAGNFNKPLGAKVSGRLDIRNFRFGPDTVTDYLHFEKFLLGINLIDLEEKKFYFDSILVKKPALLYQVYDSLDNFRRMFSSFLKEEVEEEADTAGELIDLTGSDYYVNAFAIEDGWLEFNDYSIAEKFTFLVVPFNIIADTVDKRNKRVNIAINGEINPSGTISANLSMNPDNEEYFDFKYEIRDVAASMFNPYILTYTSYQLDRGTIEMHGDWSVRDSRINSLNHFLVIDPRDTKKVRGKDTKWIPMPLILAFTRERGGAIDYQIPVSGNLDDPDFNLWDVITDILRNILVKPPTTPYRMQIRNIEEKVEKSLSVQWKMRQVVVGDNYERFVKSMAEFLEDNPEAFIVVRPVFHVEKEKENILLFEAKKKYFFESQGKEVTALSEDDSMKVEKLSSKDSTFLKFLDEKISGSGLLTLQEKCYIYVGEDAVNRKYQEMVEGRAESFLEFFTDKNTEKQVEILDVRNEFPYNWFSYYDINYKGDIPESLRDAFDELYEINNEPPREEYRIFRRRE